MHAFVIVLSWALLMGGIAYMFVGIGGSKGRGL